MANRLGDALSPYLRAHADNPVDWYPWGDEAFAEARRRDVPLLVSIGYSTCHWCHVMARESFMDADTAADMAAGFVSVKVDREEHPEVDAAFMAAASAFTQNLGWPLTVFATPEGRVFYAGTYWPPVARPPMPAFRDVLVAVREAWTQRRGEVEQSAAGVADALAEAGRAAESGSLPDAPALVAAARTIAEREDRVYGGFGGAPKFPVVTTLRQLQHPLMRREAPEAEAAAQRALAAMASSPLRDAVDGGFFRYATQRDWSVPHYERMLTDNAQLLEVAVDEGDEPTARGIAAFLLGTLRVGEAFGAAQDSESWIDGMRSEGGYYAFDAEGRAELEPPAVDGKIITGWNGLAIRALARAGVAYDEPPWVAGAANAARLVLEINRGLDGSIVRTSLGGVASTAVATLADLGLLADGLFALALATGDPGWAEHARTVLDGALAGAASDPVLAAHGIPGAADDTDGDLPSGRAAVAAAALTAWHLGAGDAYRAAAAEAVAAVAERALAQPFAHGAILRVAAGLVEPPRQLVVVTDDPHGALAGAARGTDADVVAIVSPAQASGFAAAGFAVFEGKDAEPERAYDCRAFVCRLPVSDPAGITRER
ncbi:thioredoxin domain-containing protein [Microbacterium pseudoresistens]|uniref:Spermatogenesis-associated protein 20-like TRX domain-containing protein n=1 Tax=Microbacterium pseudoresistens TaxID=640634 RepID=A0A7Y9EST1_9MICO|nr:DUF255 domain-containing protein [Microbacterium pseudoresistens]NYD53186.1 hypothetical protein [Microbacterium pseudoresistens]